MIDRIRVVCGTAGDVMKQSLLRRDGGQVQGKASDARSGADAVLAGGASALLAAGLGGGVAALAALCFASFWLVPAVLAIAGGLLYGLYLVRRHRPRTAGGHAAGGAGPQDHALSAAGPLLLLDPHDRVAYANAPAADLLGIAADRLAGLCWSDPELAARRSEIGLSLQSHAVAGGGRLLVRAATGETGRSAAPVRESVDEVYRTACLARIDAIGRFSGGVSHDLNNLMGAVAGYADFLISDLPAGSPLSDYAVRIVAAVDRAKGLARQMAVLSQAGAPGLRRVAPAGILSATLAVVRPSLPAGLSLTVQEDPDLPDVMGNAPLLAQALADLVDYLRAELSRSADPAGGAHLSLRVSLRPAGPSGCPPDRVTQAVLPSPAQPQPQVQFEVAAGGPGMRIPRLSGLFDPFATKSFETADGRVEGLRLPLVLAIVRGHDGGLTVCTDGERELAFRLTVPVASPPPVAARTEPLPCDLGDLRKCRILLVDSEPMMGDMISSGLERCGHEVAVCENAEEALEVIEEEPEAFDVLVTDQAMPGLSGMLLIAEVKARHPAMVCVLYAGSGKAAIEARARRAGADAVYAKPFDVADLARQVAVLATGRGGSAG